MLGRSHLGPVVGSRTRFLCLVLLSHLSFSGMLVSRREDARVQKGCRKVKHCGGCGLKLLPTGRSWLCSVFEQTSQGNKQTSLTWDIVCGGSRMDLPGKRKKDNKCYRVETWNWRMLSVESNVIIEWQTIVGSGHSVFRLVSSARWQDQSNGEPLSQAKELNTRSCCH